MTPGSACVVSEVTVELKPMPWWHRFRRQAAHLRNGYCLNMATERGKRRPKGKPDNPAQSKRLIEAAKRLGVDESGEAFSKALNKIVPKKPKGGNS